MLPSYIALQHRWLRGHPAHGIWERETRKETKVSYMRNYMKNLTWARWPPCYEFSKARGICWFLWCQQQAWFFFDQQFEFHTKLKIFTDFFRPKIQFLYHFNWRLCRILLCHGILLWWARTHRPNKQSWFLPRTRKV